MVDVSKEPRIYSRASQISIGDLGDKALIAFEMERERTRCQNELSRLRSAAADDDRCLEILDFMADHAADDGLLNGDLETSIDDGVTSNEESFCLRQYLPSNTMVRLWNKQLIAIGELKAGDKVLSLCINVYPNPQSESVADTKRNSGDRLRARTGPLPLPPPALRAGTLPLPAPQREHLPRKSMPLMTPNLIALSVDKAVSESLKYKRSQSLAHNAMRPVPRPNGQNVDDKSISPPSSPESGPQRARNVKYGRNWRVSKSQNNSPRSSVSSMSSRFASSASITDDADTFDKEEVLRHRLAQQRRSRFSMKEVSVNLQRVAVQQERKRKSNYLESVVVLKVEESTMAKVDEIEIVTENEMKIRCSQSQMFWIVGKGWGSFDALSRSPSPSPSASNTDTLHVLRAGEQLLTVGGHKHRIARVRVLTTKRQVPSFSVIVAKNDCFFANDLLVKNVESM